MGKPAPGYNLKVGEFSSYICPLKQVFLLIQTGGVSGYDGDCFIAQHVLFGSMSRNHSQTLWHQTANFGGKVEFEAL